jgi:hypothetical protein
MEVTLQNEKAAAHISKTACRRDRERRVNWDLPPTGRAHRERARRTYSAPGPASDAASSCKGSAAGAPECSKYFNNGVAYTLSIETLRGNGDIYMHAYLSVVGIRRFDAILNWRKQNNWQRVDVHLIAHEVCCM